MVPTAPPVLNQNKPKQLSVTKRSQGNPKQATAVETKRVRIKAVTKKTAPRAINKTQSKQKTKSRLSGTPKGIDLGGLKLAPKPYIISETDTETTTETDPSQSNRNRTRPIKQKITVGSASGPEPEPAPDLDLESDSDSDGGDSDVEHGVYRRWIAGAIRLISMDNKYIFDPATSAHIGTVMENDNIEWH